jgi:hypothetical protein
MANGEWRMVDKIHRLIGAGAFLDRRRVEVAGSDLRHLEGQLAQLGQNRFGLVAVGVVTPACCALVGLGAEELASLELGRFIDQNAQGFARAIEFMLE